MYRYIIIIITTTIAILNNFIILATSEDDGGPICFECTKLSDPYACSVLTRCGAHEKCFSAYSFFGDPLDTLLWDVGCTNASSCKVSAKRSSGSTPGSPRTHRKSGAGLTDIHESRRRRGGSPRDGVEVRDVDGSGEKFSVCAECCDGDYCNELPCQHQTAHKNVPTGLLCHSCQEVDNSSKCLEVERCQKGEVCAAWITARGLLSMGCKSVATCSAEKNNGTLQGKRSINVDEVLPESASSNISQLLELFPADDESDEEFSSYKNPKLDLMRSKPHDFNFRINAKQRALSSWLLSKMAPVYAQCSECCNTSFCAVDLCAYSIVQPVTATPISVELSPANVTATEGSNVTFVCNVTGPSPLNVTFSLVSQTTNVSSEILTCHAVIASPSPAGEDVLCVFESVSSSDAGLVSCEVTSSSHPTPVSSAASKLEVEPRGVPLQIVTAPRDTIVGGSNGFTSVTCHVDGYPAPDYQWYQNTTSSTTSSLVDVQALSSFFKVVPGANGSSSILEMSSNWRQDGDFLCVASNKYESVTLPFRLKYATDVTLVKPPSDVSVDSSKIGSGASSSGSHPNLTFSCSFDSSPTARVSWSLSSSSNQSLNVALNPAIRGVSVTSSTKDTTVTSVLTIPVDLVLKTRNADVVKCVADNGYYHSSGSSARVRFLAAPTITTPAGAKEFDLIRGRDLTLRCVADGYPKPAFQWIFSDKFGNPSILSGVSLEDSGKTLKVINMRVDGTFICKAINKQGSDSVAIKINII